MPNSPGRIDGDYSIGEHEEVQYAQPPSGYGQPMKKSTIDLRYLIAAIVILLILIAIIVFR